MISQGIRKTLIALMTMKLSRQMAAFAGLLFVAYSAPALSADAHHGKQFARRVCALCHVVVDGQRPGDPDAPSFRSIAESPQFHKKGAALLLEKHPKMPTLALTQVELDDVTAYIKSLAK
jgi:mono/diheme cytochrome c family protein